MTEQSSSRSGIGKFEISGVLILEGQEGGNAADGFMISVDEAMVDLDNLVAEHFDASRERYTGDRLIGNVRITIERFES